MKVLHSATIVLTTIEQIPNLKVEELHPDLTVSWSQNPQGETVQELTFRGYESEEELATQVYFVKERLKLVRSLLK